MSDYEIAVGIEIHAELALGVQLTARARGESTLLRAAFALEVALHE